MTDMIYLLQCIYLLFFFLLLSLFSCVKLFFFFLNCSIVFIKVYQLGCVWLHVFSVFVLPEAQSCDLLLKLFWLPFLFVIHIIYVKKKKKRFLRHFKPGRYLTLFKKIRRDLGSLEEEGGDLYLSGI